MAEQSKDTGKSTDAGAVNTTGRPQTAGKTGPEAEQAAHGPTDGAGRGRGADADRRRNLRGLTEQAAEELGGLGVNPALDNRVGRQRPRAAGPKPQQVPGPEVGQFGEHDDLIGDGFREEFGADTDADAMGGRSVGPYGRGPE